MAAAVVIAGVVIAAAYIVSSRPLRFTDKDSIVLADFDNSTGDAVFDDSLKQGLAVQMGQSPYVHLVPTAR